MNADQFTPVTPRPSATVVVFRAGPGDSAMPPELLMVKRRAGDAFGDSYTFPGGVVDSDEHKSHRFAIGLTDDQASKLLDVGSGGLDYYSAAIRELFEETGILFAKYGSGEWACDSDELLEYRRRVDCGDLDWPDFLREQGLRMACNSLHYFAHWVTPRELPKRWSTRFFLAELPPGQCAIHDGSELTDSRWMSATDVLTGSRAHGMKLPFPTRTTLRELSKLASIADIVAWADDQATAGIEEILTVPVTVNGVTKWVIPGDPDYPGSAGYPGSDHSK